MKKDRNKKDKIIYLFKKALEWIFLLILIITIFIFLFLIPDFIILFREFLYNKVNIKLNVAYNSNSNAYIQMMISIISCCITAALSLFTYRLSKILKTMESARYGAKLATAAFRLKENIENNCWIIHEAKSNLSTLKDLQYELDLDEIWFILRVAEELDNDDVVFLEEYNKRIKEIKNYSETSDQTKELETQISSLLLSPGAKFRYNDKTKKSPTPISNGGLILAPPGHFSGSAKGGASQYHFYWLPPDEGVATFFRPLAYHSLPVLGYTE